MKHEPLTPHEEDTIADILNRKDGYMEVAATKEYLMHQYIENLGGKCIDYGQLTKLYTYEGRTYKLKSTFTKVSNQALKHKKVTRLSCSDYSMLPIVPEVISEENTTGARVTVILVLLGILISIGYRIYYYLINY